MRSSPWLRAAAAAFPSLALLAAGGAEARRSLTLSSFPPLPDHRLPGLSIVVAARDEAESVKQALCSLLEQDYPDLEVIFVDDRSSDGTSEIADAVKASHPGAGRLTVIHNRELPDGWLGKVHALQLGVRASSKPLVLLTDADVHFSHDALRRSVTAREVLGADHLAVAPRFTTRGFWEPVLVAYFFVLFAARFQPSTVHRKKDRFVGVGAFTMLSREMLERLEWLEPLRLQVVDDLQLGRMVKARGGRQFALLGGDAISVRWFAGLMGVVRGLEKNAYAGLNYRLSTTVAAALFSSWTLWTVPLIAWLVSPAWALAWYGFQVLVGALAAAATGVPRWAGLAFPLAGPVLGYTMLRSAVLAERRGAIIWRGTRYSLATLRRAQAEFMASERLQSRSLVR